MLGPLTHPWNLESGVMTANSHLIQIIREIKSASKNDFPPDLIVVAGCVRESALFPLKVGEEVWVILPERGRWKKQLSNRPKKYASTPLFHNVQFSENLFDTISEMASRRKLKIINVPFELSKIGMIAENEDL
jgi:hypothetical protein